MERSDPFTAPRPGPDPAPVLAADRALAARPDVARVLVAAAAGVALTLLGAILADRGPVLAAAGLGAALVVCGAAGAVAGRPAGSVTRGAAAGASAAALAAALAWSLEVGPRVGGWGARALAQVAAAQTPGSQALLVEVLGGAVVDVTLACAGGFWLAIGLAGRVGAGGGASAARGHGGPVPRLPAMLAPALLLPGTLFGYFAVELAVAEVRAQLLANRVGGAQAALELTSTTALGAVGAALGWCVVSAAARARHPSSGVRASGVLLAAAAAAALLAAPLGALSLFPSRAPYVAIVLLGVTALAAAGGWVLGASRDAPPADVGDVLSEAILGPLVGVALAVGPLGVTAGLILATAVIPAIPPLVGDASWSSVPTVADAVARAIGVQRSAILAALPVAIGVHAVLVGISVAVQRRFP